MTDIMKKEDKEPKKTKKDAETEELKASGANAHFYVSPGTAHEWLSWRRALYNFAQLLFK